MPSQLSNIRQTPHVRGGRDNSVVFRTRVTIAGNIASGGSASCDPHGDVCAVVYGGSTGLLTLTFPQMPKGGLVAFVGKAANVDGVSCTAFDAAAGTATLATKDGGVLTNLGDTEFLELQFFGEDRS